MSPRTALTALLLALVSTATIAQEAPVARDSQRPIEQQMTPEEFAAAGLGKLSAQELAHLNAWLRGTLRIETERAAALAEDRVKVENRGFFHFGSDEPIVARIQGRFEGFGKGRRYTLDNGQVWKQTDAKRLAGVKLDSPQVTIKPGMVGDVWYLRVEGYNTAAKVERVK